MKLQKLVQDLEIVEVIVPPVFGKMLVSVPGASPGSHHDIPDMEISSIHYHSQSVSVGGLFVAIAGLKEDGHGYVPDAVKRGARVVITQRPVETEAVVIVVKNSRKAIASVSARFYDFPSEKMILIGITGTNGKTTTAYLTENILVKAGYKVGVIGTINYRYNNKVFTSPITTPGALDLQQMLSNMAADGVTHVIMEVSSHSISMGRIDQCYFDVGVFTNFTQDHLDYHKTMDAYWECKEFFFSQYLVKGPKAESAKGVYNCDDVRGKELFGKFSRNGVSVGKSMLNMVYPENVRIDLSGIQATIETPFGGLDIKSPLVGDFNLENIMQAVGVGVCLNLKRESIKDGIESLESVPGRLEKVPNDMGRFVYVDYAHTPDALENVLKTLGALCPARLICVFGCGGDRDRKKRPLMGKVAAENADLAIVTSDNPRTEPPLEIIESILSGVRSVRDNEYSMAELQHGVKDKGHGVIPDRRNAIKIAVLTSLPKDTILIAGKGHESYQIIGNKTIPFDDRLEAKIALSI